MPAARADMVIDKLHIMVNEEVHKWRNEGKSTPKTRKQSIEMIPEDEIVFPGYPVGK